MKINPTNSLEREPPLILLCGDNNRTVLLLVRSLTLEGFSVERAPSYDDMAGMWHERRYQMVLLEVSGAHGVEEAVKAALQLKRLDQLLFIAYLADPSLHTSGLAGDAIYSRDPNQLAVALRLQFGTAAEPTR
jgi:hypothetical protein